MVFRNPPITILVILCLSQKTRKKWDTTDKVYDKSSDNKHQQWIVKESNICIFTDVHPPFLLMCSFVPPAQLSYSHDHSSKSV